MAPTPCFVDQRTQFDLVAVVQSSSDLGAQTLVPLVTVGDDAVVGAAQVDVIVGGEAEVSLETSELILFWLLIVSDASVQLEISSVVLLLSKLIDHRCLLRKLPILSRLLLRSGLRCHLVESVELLVRPLLFEGFFVGVVGVAFVEETVAVSVLGLYRRDHELALVVGVRCELQTVVL